MLFREMDFVTAFMEHWASVWKKWAMACRSEGKSSGRECYALRTADMWRTFADQARLEFGKTQALAKERMTEDTPND